MRHPDFYNCEGTVKFIRTIDKVFDITNSRHPSAKGYKSALRPGSQHIWGPFIDESIKYMCNLKDA